MAQGDASRGKAAGGTGMFLKASVPDFLLTLAVSVALTSAASYGFESAPDLCGDYPAVAAFCAALLLPMFLGTYSRRTLLPGIALTAVFAAAGLALAFSKTPSGVPMFADGWVNDVAENYVVFASALVVCTVATFLLSRRKAGLAALLAAAVLCCGSVQFLFREWAWDAGGVYVSVAALLGVCALFVYQGYREGVMGAQRAKRANFAGALVFALVASGLCVGIGSALYFGVVQAVNPPSLQLKPFQQTYAQPTVEYTGGKGQDDTNSDQTTDNLNDDKNDTDQDNDSQDNNNGAIGEAYAAITKTLDAFDPNNWNASFDPVTFTRFCLTGLAVVLVVAAIMFGLVMLRRRLRKRRLEKIAGRPVPFQMRYLYEYFLRCFKKLKIERAESLTPLEFALGSRRVLGSFDDTEHGTTFVHVTDIYQRACYGGEEISPAEYDAVIGYYNAFFKNACRFSGKRRWIWRFWRI